MARTSPEAGSMMTTEPQAALCSATARASSFSAMYWIVASIVRTMSRPGTGGLRIWVW